MKFRTANVGHKSSARVWRTPKKAPPLGWFVPENQDLYYFSFHFKIMKFLCQYCMLSVLPCCHEKKINLLNFTTFFLHTNLDIYNTLIPKYSYSFKKCWFFLSRLVPFVLSLYFVGFPSFFFSFFLVPLLETFADYCITIAFSYPSILCHCIITNWVSSSWSWRSPTVHEICRWLLNNLEWGTRQIKILSQYF